MLPNVTGVAAWHSNGDEVDLLDYNDTVEDPNEQSFEAKPDALPLFDGGPFRASDHDPVIVGLMLNKPPLCEGARPSHAGLWPPNHKFRPITIQGVEDPEDDPLSFHIDSVTQDEPVNGAGDGNTAPDARDPHDGDAAVDLRAERSGSGNGRMYRISFTASDGVGQCAASVNVEVRREPREAAADDGQAYNWFDDQ